MNPPVKISVGIPSAQPINIRVKGDKLRGQMGITAPIAAGKGQPYEGPYSVTPTESAQTLPTQRTTPDNDISVDAIPSDYVGSDIPRKDSDDFIVSGATVTAPAGYYAEDASTSVANATWKGGTRYEPTLAVTVDENGLITGSVNTSSSVQPLSASGYADKNHNYGITIVASGTKQLSTQIGTTITPTTSEQTAVAAHKYTLGDVKVGAMPTATWKQASTVGVVPELSVDANGLVTANAAGWTSCHPLSASGYADSDTAANLQLAGTKTLQLETIDATTYTPNKTAVQEIPSGKFLTGIQTIGMIPSQYYDMSLDMSWLGADVTLVHEITPITVALKDTDFNTWTPSTTAATVVASQTLSAASQKYVATDLLKDGGYNYINVWNMKMPIVYTGTPTQKALPVFSCGLLITALFRRYSSYANLLIGNLNNNVAAQVTLSSFLKYYGKTQGTVTYSNSASYGFYYANVAPTISSVSAQSPTITLKTPSMTARCSDTYMSTTSAGLIDKANTKLTITCKVYRVKQDSYIQGFYRYLAARVAEMDS